MTDGTCSIHSGRFTSPSSPAPCKHARTSPAPLLSSHSQAQTHISPAPQAPCSTVDRGMVTPRVSALGLEGSKLVSRCGKWCLNGARGDERMLTEVEE